MKKNNIISIISLFIVFIILCIRYLKTGVFLECAIYELTGYYCPGCGITRLFLSLLKLDFYQAFRYNPLIFVSLPIIVILIIYIIYCYKANKEIKPMRKSIIFSLITLVILYTILRNTAYFSWLAPTVIK